MFSRLVNKEIAKLKAKILLDIYYIVSKYK